MGARPILRTRKGYELSEVVSAVQKCIRRGLADDALYWAVEMDLSGYGQYLWRRLIIIASEDIGLADRHLPATIRALYQAWTEQRGKDHAPDRLFTVNAVFLLATAEKSRLVDHALIVHYTTHDDQDREVPDYALDHHTRRGRIKKRDFTFFFDEGIQLHPQAEIDDDYHDVAQSLMEEGRQTLLPVKNPKDMPVLGEQLELGGKN